VIIQNSIYYQNQVNCTPTVGAGIARPTYTGNTIHSKRIVPADMGRAMLAPTIVHGYQNYLLIFLPEINKKDLTRLDDYVMML